MVPHRVGGYPGETAFLERQWVQESGVGGSSDYG